mgnify:CR=1 FL=1
MEYAIIFAIIFVLLSIPAVWSQISLGVRRCHDINKPGLMFAVPFICYLASYVLPVLGQDTAAMQLSRSWLCLIWLVYRQGDVRRQCLWPGTGAIGGGSMTLAEGKIGCDYIVEKLTLPDQTEKRLQALGMIEGTEISVLNNKNEGTVIIKMRSTRLALGKGISSHIEVRGRIMTSEVKAQTREAQVPKAPAQVEKKEMTVAFIGNPNCGKTTLFNAYTGANLKVANWPGVTVEKVEGAINAHGYHIHLVDLPGTYSLTSYTMEEQVSRNFILSDDVDVIVDVIDASAWNAIST